MSLFYVRWFEHLYTGFVSTVTIRFLRFLIKEIYSRCGQQLQISCVQNAVLYTRQQVALQIEGGQGQQRLILKYRHVTKLQAGLRTQPVEENYKWGNEYCDSLNWEKFFGHIPRRRLLHVSYCIVVGSRWLMPLDALQPKAYCTDPGLQLFLLAPPGVSTRDPSSERRNYLGEKWPMNFA